jgi:hypothetical protein
VAACLEKTIGRISYLSFFISFLVFLLNIQISFSKIVELMFIICLLHQQLTANAGINGPQDETDTQQKVEATAENNAAGYRSSGEAACIQINKDLIEKGSDAQSSCTKPNMEAESGLVDNMQEFSQLKCADAYPSETKTQDVDIHLGQALITQDSRTGGKFHSFTAITNIFFDSISKI